MCQLRNESIEGCSSLGAIGWKFNSFFRLRWPSKLIEHIWNMLHILGPPWSATLSIAPLIFLMLNPYSLFRVCGRSPPSKKFREEKQSCFSKMFSYEINRPFEIFSEVIFTAWPWKMLLYKFVLLLFAKEINLTKIIINTTLSYI